MNEGEVNEAPAPEWPVQAADTIENLVGQVRDKTAGPAVSISRMVVLGLVAAFVGLAVLVMLAIGLVRVIDAYLPGNVWGAHLLVGVVFVVFGVALWTKRT